MKYIFLLVVLAGCEILPFDHPYKDTYRDYEIKKGNNHASNRGLLTFNGRTMKFKFILFSNCFYEAKDSAIHKVYGFSDLTQKNSMRVGFRAKQDNTIDLFAYWHVDGKFGYQWLGNTELDVENHAELKVRDNRFIFEINGNTYERKGNINGLKHRLFPYFEDGKGRGAYHRMLFYIHEY